MRKDSSTNIMIIKKKKETKEKWEKENFWWHSHPKWPIDV